MKRFRRYRMTLKCVILALLLSCVCSVQAGLMEENNVRYLRYAVGEAAQWETPRYPMEYDEGLSEEAQLEAMNLWWSARDARSHLEIPRVDQIQAFSEKSVRAFLETAVSENFICSPISLWLYVNLLSDLSAGGTQAQLLTALNSEDETARLEQLDAVWKALCWDDGRLASVPAAAIWLNGGIDISDNTLSTLNTRDYASVYRGNMGDADYDAALQAWLNKKTRNLLADITSELHFQPESSLSACSVLYFRTMWESTFDVDDTAPDVFYTQDGPIDTDFMYISEMGTVYRGESFSAYIKPFRDGGCAAFVLPNEDIMPEELLQSDEVFRFFAKGDQWDQGSTGTVNLSMPKLDLSECLSLEKGLRELGITDIFDEEAANFEGRLSSDAPIALSFPQQLCRLVVNEDGVEAAAITISDVVGALAMPEEEIDFVLDRPFVFAVMDNWKLPLFIGLVREP